MNHISHLDCRIRVVGQAEAAYQLGARLEADIKQRVAEAYSAALDQAFEGDPSVYVMRGIRLRLNVALSERDTSKFVQQVAIKMASAAQRSALLNDDTVRFENQADYQAHFIADLLRGQAWDSWIYGPFRQFKALPLQQLLKNILLEDPQILTETLARLREMGQLETLLKTLPRTAQLEVWEQVGHPDRRNNEQLPETWRPFYAVALNLLYRLGMKLSEPPDLETLLRHLPDRSSSEVDWRDRQSLASAVMDMLLLLSRQGYVRPLSEMHLDEHETLSALNEALQPLDWLDQEYLKKGLWNWFAKRGSSQNSQRLVSRPSVVTPRQAKVLADLLAALQAHDSDLNRLRPDSAENALRLLAALSAHASHWQNDSLSPRVIAVLLAAWESLTHAYEPAQVLHALQQADLATAMKYLPQAYQDRGQKNFRELLRFGPTAVTVLALIGEHQSPSTNNVTTIETRCAGIALLLRAVLEGRLPYWLKNNDFPDPALSAEQRLQAILLGCFEAWAGTASTDSEPEETLSRQTTHAEQEPGYDPGFLILAGIDLESEISNPYPRFSLSDLSMFQESWEEHLAGLHMAHTGNLADDLLRLWARWLRGFPESSVPFLLENFIRRPGSLLISPTEIKVEMEPHSLDIVLEMADYLAPIENISWLRGRRLSFVIAND